MESIATIADVLGKGGIGVATLAILAAAYMFKQNQTLAATQKVEIQALNDKVVGVVEKVLPVVIGIPSAVDKLHDATERLDRISDRCAGK